MKRWFMLAVKVKLVQSQCPGVSDGRAFEVTGFGKGGARIA